MNIRRAWAMPSRDTFSMRPIAELIGNAIAESRARFMLAPAPVIDPFSGISRLADITNDIDPSKNADHDMDAIQFLSTFKDSSVGGVLFDPPYSPRQVSECYRSLSKTVNMQTTQASFWSKTKEQICRIVKTGGFCVTCGWNSGGIGKKYGFEIAEILLVAHGGWHNDTIVTLETKV